MQTFRILYDKSPILSLKGLSLEEKYRALGIKEKYSFTTHFIQEAICNRIKTTLQTTEANYITNSDLNNLRDAFFYSEKLFGKSEDWKYFVALHELRSIVGAHMKKYRPFTNENVWLEALKLLKCYIELYGVKDEYTILIGLEEQQHRVKAIKKLERKGLQCIINDANELSFSNEFACYKELSCLMEKIGGVRFVNRLLNTTMYDASKGRFILPPPQDPNPCNVKPAVPVGYLLNMAFRKISSKGSDEALVRHWKEVIQLATDICVAFCPTQSYFAFNDMFYDDPAIYMRKWIVYDSTLNMQQMSKEFCLGVMNFLIDRIISEGKYISKIYTLIEYKSIMNEIIGYTKEKEFVQLKRYQIVSIANEEHKSSLIEDISNRTVNPNFEKPLDYEKVNWSDKPVIGLPNGDLLLYPSSIGTIGWYETMMSLLREQDKDIDNFVGYALEDFVKDKLLKKGIATKCGKYKVDSVIGECDVVVENVGTIILMELKKKNLTRAAREGHLFQIILDFAGSILYSQEQAFRTETLLKKKGQIFLDDNGKESVLDYQNRLCEKVTITLNEYGPLHERIIQQGVLGAFHKYLYSVNPDEIRAFILDSKKADETIENYKRLEKKQKSLEQYISELSNYETPGEYDPFFNSWFFSIEQLCYLIDKSVDTDDFINKFQKLKYLSFSSRDFWLEVDLKLGIRA